MKWGAEFGGDSAETSHKANFFAEEQKTWKHAAFDEDMNSHQSFIPSGQNFPSSLSVCLFVGVCLSIYEPQCRAGPGRGGFCDGVGGLCFAAQSSKSCLSVLSSWTS